MVISRHALEQPWVELACDICTAITGQHWSSAIRFTATQ